MPAAGDLYIGDVIVQLIAFVDEGGDEVHRVIDGVDDAVAITVFRLVLGAAFEKELQPGMIVTCPYQVLHDTIALLIIGWVELVFRAPPEGAGEKPYPCEKIRMMPYDVHGAEGTQ